MSEPVDVLLLGSGAFAARVAFDLAATARHPVSVLAAGRNVPRLDWLRTAANARAALFGTPARFTTRQSDLMADGAAAELLAHCRPAVVVQAASVQPGSVIATRTGWSRLVAEGGLSATAVFQARLTVVVAQAVRDACPSAHLLNCCFPDVVNGMVAALGLPVLCGTGNVGILSNAFAGLLPAEERAGLSVLAHYQQLGAWRLRAEERAGTAPRVWLDGAEVADTYSRFASVRLTPEPAVDISGASGVPLILAVASGGTWQGHVPGPHGLPGGYPVRWEGGELLLAPPPGMTRDEAVAWNAQFEARNGLVIEGTHARYTGRLAELLHDLSPALAAGFDLHDLPQAHAAMQELRSKLEQEA